MHHSHPNLAVFFIVFGGTLVLMVVVMAFARRWQQHRNAGPLQEQWYEARGALASQQRRELWRANARRRLVKRPELAPAQLAWARYTAESFRRAPIVRRRWLRIMFPVVYLALAAMQLGLAYSGPHVDVFSLISAACFLELALFFTYLARHGLRKAERRIDNLRQQLQYRFGQREDAVLRFRPAAGGSGGDESGRRDRGPHGPGPRRRRHP